MHKTEFQFSSKKVSFYFDATFKQLTSIVSQKNSIVITDSTVHAAHKDLFADWNTVIIPAGEAHKQPATVQYIIEQLIQFEADRQSILIGVGGGVVTDITGYVAGIYMRGIAFGFVPTTLLAMVDAAIGGKNGIDAGLYKNMIGLFRQPDFLLYDYSFLKTLPDSEWINGFAEIIKHACIKDATLFEQLQQHQLADYQQQPNLLSALINRNAQIKARVVEKDEFEKADRKLLNFGHTLGHAIENLLAISHGSAVSIGMMAAATISEEIGNFPSTEKAKLQQILAQYQLPVKADYDRRKAWEILKMDKKRKGDEMQFVLLEQIGKAVVKNIPLVQLENLVASIL
ncbi:MAG: 3-dehydroquinate synthase [Bacteroidota bacterium]|jgi:3-dehydroquinate synthase